MTAAVLQLALSWLAVPVFRLPAVNYYPSVVYVSLFTLAEAVWYSS